MHREELQAIGSAETRHEQLDARELFADGRGPVPAQIERDIAPRRNGVFEPHQQFLGMVGLGRDRPIRHVVGVGLHGVDEPLAADFGANLKSFARAELELGHGLGRHLRGAHFHPSSGIDHQRLLGLIEHHLDRSVGAIALERNRLARRRAGRGNHAGLTAARERELFDRQRSGGHDLGGSFLPKHVVGSQPRQAPLFPQRQRRFGRNAQHPPRAENRLGQVKRHPRRAVVVARDERPWHAGLADASGQHMQSGIEIHEQAFEGLVMNIEPQGCREIDAALRELVTQILAQEREAAAFLGGAFGQRPKADSRFPAHIDTPASKALGSRARQFIGHAMIDHRRHFFGEVANQSRAGRGRQLEGEADRPAGGAIAALRPVAAHIAGAVDEQAQSSVGPGAEQCPVVGGRGVVGSSVVFVIGGPSGAS